jgi:mono/diheme cytochrome c family protein
VPLALTGYETGLLAVALVFIAFALIVALAVPRARPSFPARHLGWFIGVVIVLFAAQMTAVLLLAELGEEHESAAAETQPPETETTPTEPAPTEPPPTEPAPTETAPTETTSTETTPTETTDTTETTEPAEGQGDPVAGKAVFNGQAACGSCHTLADAGSSGAVGPNLDAASPSFDKVVERVTNGQGVMPSFRDTLSEQQIRDVAAYVSSVASG